MKIGNLIVAVDGYSSTGKSSFAKIVAKQLGLLYLDSGALYRGVTLFAQEEGLISGANVISPALRGRLSELDLHFNAEGKTCMGSRCVEKQIRGLEVSSQVSPISAESYVRDFVDGILHKLGANGGIIMDGRDIGTTVFPNAQVKIFMTASDEVRAKRRYEELLSKGEHPSFEDVVANIKTRDFVDSHRDTSPLRRAHDAFVLDNSNMTIEEEVAWAKGLIQGKMGILE